MREAHRSTHRPLTCLLSCICHLHGGVSFHIRLGWCGWGGRTQGAGGSQATHSHKCSRHLHDVKRQCIRRQENGKHLSGAFCHQDGLVWCDAWAMTDLQALGFVLQVPTAQHAPSVAGVHACMCACAHAHMNAESMHITCSMSHHTGGRA